MKIVKIKTLNEEIESISDVDYSVIDHNLADAKRQEAESKEKFAKIVDDKMKEFSVEDRDAHSKVSTPVLKKMYLSESLFEEYVEESIDGNTSHAQDFISALRSAGFGDGFDQKLKIDTYGNGGTRIEFKDQGGTFTVTITDDKVVLEGQDEGDAPFKKEFSTWEEFASEFESLYPGIPVRENKILVEASQSNDINKLYFKWSGDREWFSFAPYMEGISEEDDTWNYALESAWDESEGGDGAAFNDEALDLGYKGIVDKSLNTELDDNQIYDQILQKGYYDLFGYTKEEWESLKGNPIETIVVSGREIPVASFNKEKYGDLSFRALQVLKSYKELKEEPLNEASYTRSDNKKMLVKPNRDPLVDVIQLTLTDGEWGYVKSPDGTVTPSLLPHLSYDIHDVGVSFDNEGRYFVRVWDINEESLQKVADVAKQFNREYKIGFDKYAKGDKKWYCLIYLNEDTDFDDPYVDPEAEVNSEGIKGRGTKLRGNPEARHARDNEDLEDSQRYPIESPVPAQTGLLSEDVSVNGSLMEDKISTDMIHDFKPEAGVAEETFNRVLEAGKMETFEFMLEDRFPHGVTTEELNKILSDEAQWVYDQLGMKEFLIPEEE